jgi:hypothetical protein
VTFAELSGPSTLLGLKVRLQERTEGGGTTEITAPAPEAEQFRLLAPHALEELSVILKVRGYVPLLTDGATFTVVWKPFDPPGGIVTSE